MYGSAEQDFDEMNSKNTVSFRPPGLIITPDSVKD